MKSPALMQCITGLWLAAITASGLGAADQPDDQARLRETLRSTMLQLNDAQAQLASLQAAQTSDADQRKALADQVALLTKRSTEDQEAKTKEIESLKAKLAEQQAAAARLQESVAQWRAAAEKASLAARGAAGARDKASASAVALERRVEDLSGRNAELFRIGSEILDRYEKFSLGAQFLAREPFVGRARVELENQIQDYEDKLTAQEDIPPDKNAAANVQ
jgi:chromosome segregation ATPase